jgi:hypothetical protein
MDVFLIPVGEARYELYCEVSEPHRTVHLFDGRIVEETDTRDEEATAGWRRRVADRFSAIVHRVEAARQGAAHRRATRVPRPFARRLRDRAVCWLAEKIAEQRLLWHLRGEQKATLWFPDDLAGPAALDRVRAMLRADADRHLRWLVVDAAGLVASLALVPIPGPNLVLYYFTFRAGGHYLSRRGASHGVADVEWAPRPSSALTELRAVAALDPDRRRPHVSEIASRLQLQHLAAFFDRIAAPTP